MNNFFTSITKKTVSLDQHEIDKKDTNYILKLLSSKPETPVHILLYGTPGTGKSSYSYGLINKLKIPAYEIIRTENNKSLDRRAAITACLNMTNTNNGSIILVDEADNMLNTESSWSFSGETQDKGWLNQLLEKKGVRMIWIVNTIENIDDSVIRRFTYSLQFKVFNKSMRVKLWNNILKNNKAKHLIKQKEVKNFAKKFNVNAGVIDLAIKKVMEINCKSQNEYLEIINKSLTAYKTLVNYGKISINKNRIEKSYTLDGLNIKGDINLIMDQLKKFDQFLQNSEKDNIKNFNLLFYGLPGTGKSELAKYIAEDLDKELICKRISDIQSKWVGESEKNIKNAFEEAEQNEAVLVFDEVDSILFPRQQAQHSWEISFTNEFLTQMEKFRGILICTTNNLTGLDEASIRRFNYKLKFEYLTSKGNIIFYKNLLVPLTKKQLKKSELKKLESMHNLAPGDFKIVKDKFSFYKPDQLSNSDLINSLHEESKIKIDYQGGNPIGF